MHQACLHDLRRVHSGWARGVLVQSSDACVLCDALAFEQVLEMT